MTNHAKFLLSTIVIIVAVLIGYAALAQPTGINTLPPGFPLAVGPKPALTGSCTTGGQVGGIFAGSFTATCTLGQNVVMTFPFPAPNGWSCDAHDLTTPADTINQSATTATSATLTDAVATGAGDTISFKCAAY